MGREVSESSTLGGHSGDCFPIARSNYDRVQQANAKLEPEDGMQISAQFENN